MRKNNLSTLQRRHALVSLAGVSALALTPALTHSQNAERRTTPAQGLGPFYPRSASERPRQTDNDLVTVDGDRVLTKGTPLYLTGRVVTRRGQRVAHAQVEIWQCDANAVYHHPAGGAEAERDQTFQGYGQTRTDGEGAFHFRTIRPVPYPGRAPHIHVRVEAAGLATLGTQLYLADDPGNARDFLFRRLNEAERLAVTLSLLPTAATHPLARGTRHSAAVELVVA
jgi:protocatechuate 3,4-dioxygenase beta subunit